MNEPDGSLDILIRLISELKGATQASAALKDLSNDAKSVEHSAKDGMDPALAHASETATELGKETERLGLTHRDLGRALHALGPEAAMAGHFMMSSFANPVLLGVLAVVGVMKLMDTSMKKLIEEGHDIGGSVAPNMDKIHESAVDAQAALLEFWDSLKQGIGIEERLSAATAAAIEKIKAQADAAKGLSDAQKDFDLAALKQRKESGAISQENYEREKAQIEAAAERRRIDHEKAEREAVLREHWRESDAALAEAERAKEQIPGLFAESQAASDAAAANADRLAKARGNEYKAKQAKGLTEGELEAVRVNHAVLEAAEKAQPELAAAAKAAQDALSKAEATAKSLKQKAATLADLAITESHVVDTKNLSAEDVFKWKQQQAGMQGPFGAAAARDVAEASATARAIQEHKEITQGAAGQLVAVASAIAGHSFTVKQAAEAMSRVSENNGVFAADVMRLVGIMEGMVKWGTALKGKVDYIEGQVRALGYTMPGAG